MSIHKSKTHLYLQGLTFKRRNTCMFMQDMSFQFIIICQLSGKMNIQGHRKNQTKKLQNLIDCSGKGIE